MSRASRGSAWEGPNRPFARTLFSLMSERPVTTQAQLAEITGKSRQTISQYVNGTSEPPYDTLVVIADYFNVSIDYLLGRSTTKTTDLCIQAICEKTGLSENSIDLLRKFVQPTDDTSHYCYNSYNDVSDYVFQLVNEFIDFALSYHNGYGLPFNDYLTFRQQNDQHRENAEKWHQTTPKECEHTSSAMLTTTREIFEQGMFPLAPTDASDFFRKRFCDNFKDYLKSKYPLVNYPIPLELARYVGEYY